MFPVDLDWPEKKWERVFAGFNPVLIKLVGINFKGICFLSLGRYGIPEYQQKKEPQGGFKHTIKANKKAQSGKLNLPAGRQEQKAKNICSLTDLAQIYYIYSIMRIRVCKKIIGVL